MKRCPRCKTLKEFSAFSKHAGRHRGLQSNCKACFKELHADWYKKNAQKESKRSKESQRPRHLMRKYGMDEWKYAELYVEQGAGCAICREFQETLYVDHDHKTGKIRGLLCRKCNFGLGLFGDSVDKLLRAVNYLD